MDIREICIDEIALEGLDGITIPTLWLRLQNREPKIPVQLTDAIKNYLWNYLVQHDSLEIFRLPEDRQEPQIFNRFENLTANAVAPSTAPDELETLVDVYSVTTLKIDDGVRGACSNYDKRLNITDEVKHLSYTLNTCMAQYGTRRIVVVASKELREKALLSTGVSPIIFAELSDTAYFVLERIGRARWQGELQAALNKLNFKDKTSHIYYIINKLQKFGLLVKNNHTYKRPDLNNRTIFQILVHLSRFEHDCRNFTARSIDAIRTLVKTYPDQTITLGELRDRLKIDSRSLKTMYQTMVKTGEAVIQNKNPNKAAKSIFEKSFTLIEKPEIIETEEDEDDDISNIFVNNPTTRPIILEQPFLQQAFNYMHENGSKGITQVEVLKFLTGYGRLESRNICKVLTRMKVVNTVLVDRGKQRVRVFIPTDFANSSIKNQEFKDEKKKMKKLIVESTKFTSDKEDLSACDETMDCSSSEYETSVMNDSILQGTKMDVSSQESSTSLLNDCGLNESDQDDLNFLSEDDNRANRLNKIMNYKAPQNYQQLKKWDAHLTARRIRRHNLILEQLSSEKIIEGYTTLQRVLTKAEEEEGVKTKIDKKTVMRLIDKMHEDGILQHSVIPIEHASKTEDFHFIMALDCPMKLLKSAVEQARFKRLGDEENKAARLEQKRKKNVLAKEKSIVKEAVIDTGKMTRQFFQPKFKRARTIHKLLWYLLYGHPKALNWTVEKGIVNPDESVIYCEEHTWKRFLPPAPIHFHHDQRWLQLGDVAIILPLSIFTQFHRTTHDVEDIDIWLSDNERRHTLVRHLPPTMRTQLFYKRKYMYSLMVCIEQLAFMGLVTMRRGRSGNNCNMPKENMLIYVHKNASVLDTRPTTKQHIKIEEKEYEKISFAFDHYSDVEEFWFKLQDICVQTRLGFTEFRELGYEVNADHFCTKELKKYIQNLKKGQHVPDDDGEIPGDHRGAAGLDSSMFSPVAY